MYNEYKIKTFNDSIGRTCFGEVVEETDETLVLKTPATIMVTPTETGQMKVDVIPLFFAEFIEADEEGKKDSVFTFRKDNIALVDVNVSEKILEHYFTKLNIKALPESDVKLFD